MRRLLFSVLISIAVFKTADAQSLEQTLAMGDSFMRQSRFDAAVRVYDRALFFAADSLKQRARIGLGRAYFALGNYKLSADAYSNVIDISEIDSNVYSVLIEKVRAEIWSGYFGRAERTLRLIDTAVTSEYKKRRIFYTGVLHFAAENFELAETEFLKLVSGNPRDVDEVKDLFRNLQHSERRSPKAAWLMSILLPGSGQIYAGKTEDGINSLLLTGAWAALTITTYKIYGPFHALVTAFPWFLRYYTGGVGNAAAMTLQMQKERRDKIYRKLLQVVAE
jgi:tetratricopeptide (TPR) repeat protein